MATGAPLTSSGYGLTGLDWLADLLAEDGVLDCAYRLNVEMMRKGPTMYRRFCNPWLVRSILDSNHH